MKKTKQEKRSLYEERQHAELSQLNQTVSRQDISMSSEDRSDIDKDLPTTSPSKISNEVGTKSRKRRKYVLRRR